MGKRKSNKKSATKFQGDSAPALIKATKTLKKGKRDHEAYSKTKVNAKKQRKVVKLPKKLESDSPDSVVTEEKLEKALAASTTTNGSDSESDDDAVMAREETPKKKEVKDEDCCFAPEDAYDDNQSTLFVTGFDSSLGIEEIRSALTKHFSSCGEPRRVFVLYECLTRVPLGFAMINMRVHTETDKALLTLDGSDMGGWKLKVVRASTRPEYNGLVDYHGCGSKHHNIFARRKALFAGYGRNGRGPRFKYHPRPCWKWENY